MAIRTTNWLPDTCGCWIQLDYDDTTALDINSRIYTPTNTVQTCSFHASQPDTVSRHSVIKDENNRKNDAIQVILDNAPSTVWNLQADGVTRVFKKGITVTFNLSGTVPNRVVNISVVGVTLTNTQKNAIQTKLDTKFGTGKVVIV